MDKFKKQFEYKDHFVIQEYKSYRHHYTLLNTSKHLSHHRLTSPLPCEYLLSQYEVHQKNIN